MKDITIYHKVDNIYKRYVVNASYRNVSILNRNKNSTSVTDNVLIRIFDKGYKTKWNLSKGDIIVNNIVNNEITGTSPQIELAKLYGAENVHKVTSIEELIFGEDLDHIKIGAI